MSGSAIPAPIFLLGPPRSYTSLVCAMLGQHPQAYGVPELNLFAAGTLRELLIEMAGMRQIQLHGLLRTVAQLHAGEQTMASIELANRWVARRLDRSTAEIYRTIADRVAPLAIVDKSPIYVSTDRVIARLAEAFPQARYVHLLRHPFNQGRSVMNVADGIMAVVTNSVDYTTDPPTPDPQIMWYRCHRRIRRFLAGIPQERKLTVQGERVMEHPEAELGRICAHFGLDTGTEAIAAMLRPEASPYASVGPLGAHLGNDLNFLEAPAFRRHTPKLGTLGDPLPWRSDGGSFRPEVREMAAELGYS